MRGRAYAFLVMVEDRLSPEAVEIAHELIDHNEYGVAVEIMADMLVEGEQELTEPESAFLGSMLADMGLSPPQA